jgi:uncharacterized protein (TIGR03083 family)
MQLAPRYGTDPLVRIDGAPGAVGVPLLRQRRRFAAAVRALSPAQWATPSRCDGWRVQDVVAHLTTVDQFWNLSIASGLAGSPTRILAAFDPKATPAALVDAVRDTGPDETQAAYLEACEALCSTVESLDDDGWKALAESPAGHVSVAAAAHHALWDSWVHERDVLTPLGLDQVEEDDEVVAGLRYAAALGPALALQTSTARPGTIVLEVTRPAARVVVTVGDAVHVGDGDAPADALVLTGDAVDVLEALSVRAPWRQPIPAEHAWLLAGLTDVFETAPPGG